MSRSALLNGLGPDLSAPATPASGLQAYDPLTLSERYQQYAQQDLERSNFMSDLVKQYQLLNQHHQATLSEQNRQREWVLQWQVEKQQYKLWLQNMQCAMADNPFVMVLIDGDGMIFTDSFLREGEQGGRRAASQLLAALQDYIKSEDTCVPLGARIVCRIYANVRRLGSELVRCGALYDVGQLEDFVTGFTNEETLFDFVDVGRGKDVVHKKITETLKLNAQDYHCRRLLFGGSHDNGYARTLEEYCDNADLLKKILLLEGVPFEKELSSLPYDTKKFPGLFRQTKPAVWDGQNGSGPSLYGDSSPYGQKTYNILSGLPTRFPAPVRSPSNGNVLLDSPLPARAILMNLPRTPSSSTLASDGLPAVKATIPDSWAAKAAAPAPSVSQLPVYKPAGREEVIARNRAGQRVDPPCRDYDKTEVDRIKKIKMCNVHFLRHECPYDKECTHLHAYKPTGEELLTLRLVARMAPCQNGSGCQDIKCIYGHRCPAPPHKTHHTKGTKSCIFGEQCKFPPELHDVDTNVVKTLVIR